MSEEPAEKPKLIIDDDWKERVQSEKEAAAAAVQKETPDSDAQTSGGPESSSPEGGGQAGTAQEDIAQEHVASDGSPPEHELPPASFATLVHSLTAQALSSLGQIPDAGGNTRVEIGLGKHFIDTLAVLEEKTKGNLDDEESAALAKMLYELRMLFVHVRKEQSEGPPATEPPLSS
jgi:hypothetical protein